MIVAATINRNFSKQGLSVNGTINLLTTNVSIIYKPVSWFAGFYMMGTLVVKRLKQFIISVTFVFKIVPINDQSHHHGHWIQHHYITIGDRGCFWTRLFPPWNSTYSVIVLANCLVMDVRYNCSEHRSLHLFVIAISSHSHIRRNQPQRTFFQCSCSVTIIIIMN